MTTCTHCNDPIGFWSRLINSQQCPVCRKAVKLARARWNAALDGCLEDRVLTAEEEAGLFAFAEQLHLTRADLAPLDYKLDRGRKISAALLNQAPIMPCSLNLKRGEQCLWSSPTDLLEERVRREYHRGSRGTSIRIAKGVSFRVGATRGYSVPVHYMATIASGHMYITTARTMFVSPSKSITVTHEQLLSFEAFGDGLQLHTGRGSKQQMFKFYDGEYAAAILSGLLNPPSHVFGSRPMGPVTYAYPGLTTYQARQLAG